MTHLIPDKEIKGKILNHNTLPNKMKTTPIIDVCIREHLIEKKRTLPLHHEDALMGIRDKIGHAFGERERERERER